MPEKLFRDPLYDYIAIDKNSWLLGLINCPEVQRLRYVSQLGLSQFTYPGATHSRFSHSLGALHLMQQCLEYLEKDHKDYFRNGDKEALLAAILLHDIGHGPFSHASESVRGEHEDRGVQIIASPQSDVNQKLCSVDGGLPSKVATLLAKEPPKGAAPPPPWQKSLISSQLDMDRLDYLRRDSLCSGAEYGSFDWFRIIHTMQLKERAIPDRQPQTLLVWPDKSKFALEEYIFSRFYMYQSVYFHHTTRGFEGLLQRILERARDLARAKKSFARRLLAPVKTFCESTTSTHLEEFRNLTDSVVLAQVTIWQSEEDKVLSDLSRRLLARRGLAWQEIEQKTAFEVVDKVSSVRDYLHGQELDPQYYFFEDNAKAIAYKPYRPASEVEDQSSVNSIILHDPSWEGTRFKEISDIPDLQRLKTITTDKPSPVMRYYFPKEHETQIRRLLS